MLVVDPVHRITVAEIRQLPWFNENLPDYLHPLPSTPSAERSPFGELLWPGDGAEVIKRHGPGAGGMTMSPAFQQHVSSPFLPPPKESSNFSLGSNGMVDDVCDKKGAVITVDLGPLDPKVVDELCVKMAGLGSSDDVWAALRMDGDNHVKVAYQLLRDHDRMPDEGQSAATSRSLELGTDLEYS